MPDVRPEVLEKMTLNQRWQARMIQAWSELKPERHTDARFYTDYAVIEETPTGDGRVTRERRHDLGKIQVWAPGKPSIKQFEAGAVTEIYNGEPWYGFVAVVKKSTNYADHLKAIRALLSKFKG